MVAGKPGKSLGQCGLCGAWRSPGVCLHQHQPATAASSLPVETWPTQCEVMVACVKDSTARDKNPAQKEQKKSYKEECGGGAAPGGTVTRGFSDVTAPSLSVCLVVSVVVSFSLSY